MTRHIPTCVIKKTLVNMRYKKSWRYPGCSRSSEKCRRRSYLWKFKGDRKSPGGGERSES